ncbi:Solute carrier 2, facilitated glucose transporter member 5 [Chamberlinius hualienensis]
MFTNSQLSIASKNSIGTLKNGAVVNVEEWTTKKGQHGMTFSLFMTSVAVLMCSAVPTGYNIGVLNPPQEILQRFCNETILSTYGVVLTKSQLDLVWSIVVSIYLIGGMIGSLSAGWLCNTFGRKGAIIYVNWLGLISAILFSSCKLASSIEMLIIGRVIVGVFSGFSMSALPLYLGEISPARLKESLGVLQPLGMTFGLIIALVLGLDSVLGNEWGWPYLLGLYGGSVAIFTAVLLFCPESPKYLFVVKSNSDQSVKELCRLRNCEVEELEDEIIEMKQDIRQDISGSTWTFAKVITSSESRFSVLILVLLHAGQQLAGINAVFYYSTGIFSSAGMNREESQYASIGAGFANFLMAALSTWLVSRFRRRPMLLTSVICTIICLIGLTTSFYFMTSVSFAPYLAIAFLLLFVLTYGIGLGPIPYFIGNELFTSGPRPIAMSIGCAANTAANFIVGLTFPSLQAAIGEFSFLVFVGISILLLIFIFFCLPETKDKDIGRQLKVTISFQDNHIVVQNPEELALTPINEC